MNRDDLRVLAKERIKDAKVLLRGKRWEFAYYTAGYAVECALKACVLTRMIYTGWVFEEKWKADQCLTHNLDFLVTLAGLRAELNAKVGVTSPLGGEPPIPGTFSDFWDTVCLWKVTSRYEAKTEAEARALFEAITDKSDGVLKWIQSYW